MTQTWPPSPPSPRLCLQCSKDFVPPPSAPHKRFCSSACRQIHWRLRRREGEALLQQAEGRFAAKEPLP